MTLPITIQTVGLLFVSNIFMTFAWYGHLKFTDKPIWIVIAISWAIAFFEYCLQVPANRIGYGHFSAVELKTIQEALTLFVFVGFSFWYLGEPLKWNHYLGFGLMIAAVYVIFNEW
ncbi:MAG: DMT family protein [Rickettsiales bacterium]|nr:DMT family protein [Rickettsiales bacterium]